MTEPEKAATTVPSVLGDVARRRADLFEAIVGLEGAAARPASGREADWTEGVLEATGEVRDHVIEHIETTEHPEGLYAEITAHAPRLLHRIGVLREEHLRMRHDVTALEHRLHANPPADADGVANTRQDVQVLLGLLVKHRQHGADLVWEAFTLDIGNTG
ncbi:MAG: hypothetical protein ACKVUT_06045 [Gaiella sp.]